MSENAKLGTFSGVFLPAVLTILGAVMYYIAPQVVGAVGITKTIIIILIAHSVTIATAFSISTIATNINVKGGGMYYLISRSLGTEFGGSLGIQLFLAQTIASAFYCIAFARGIVSILSKFGWVIPEQTLALYAVAIIGILVLIGVRFVVKIQFYILAAIILSLLSIFLGAQTQTLTSSMMVTSTLPFWIAFAMYFPAVTGIDAGVGMSGELKNPRKSLVAGTFYAIIITMLIYLATAIKLALAASPSQLMGDPRIVEHIALFPALILLGVIMATSSSALSSLMTAPRCLTAMVEDGIFPKWCHFLNRKFGKNKEPRVAITLSLLIAAAIILLGPLEFVSQIVAMFFLSVYGWINGAAFFEKISHNPSFRPTFNPPTIIPFYGMLICYIIMWLFSPWVMILGIIFQLLIFFLLFRFKKSMKLEGVWDGVFFQLLRLLLKRMDEMEQTKKNWRPTILAFCANELNKAQLANVLHWIGSKRSVTKMFFLTKGELSNKATERQRLENSLMEYVKENKLDIFPKIILCDSFENSIDTIMQSETIGNLPLNTVLIDFDKKINIDRLTADMVRLGKNIIVMRNQSGVSSFKRVDIWYEHERNGNFMILLGYLITHSRQWLEDGAVIHVFRIMEHQVEDEMKKLNDVLADSRIENIEVHFIKKKGKIKDIIAKNSQDSDLVILGLPYETSMRIKEHISAYTKKLKFTLCVLAKEKIDFKVN